MAGSSPDVIFMLADRIKEIKDRLCDMGRADVKLVAVTKTHGPELITELLKLGQLDIGENRQNEARDKIPLVDTSFLPAGIHPVYHHIGPLQSGSARQVPGLFQWVHGVSSLSALEALIKAAENYREHYEGKLEPHLFPIRYLIQLNLTDEASKAGGITLEELESWKGFPGSEHVIMRGFMTMGPTSQDLQETRSVFQRAREIRDSMFSGGELSMGMSGDWEIAVEEGATIIRLGSTLVGPRNQGPWKPGK